MKKFGFTFIILLGSSAAMAQPMSAPTKPDPIVPMEAKPVMKPVKRTPMVSLPSPMVVKPIAVMKASQPIVEPSSSESKTKPVHKTASFWIFQILLPVLFFALGLLVFLGVIKKSWLQWLRKKNVIEIADKVVNQFEIYAKGTAPNWDDILAQALKAVIVRLGELSDDEENTVRKIVEERKEQAEKKTTKHLRVKP